MISWLVVGWFGKPVRRACLIYILSFLISLLTSLLSPLVLTWPHLICWAISVVSPFSQAHHELISELQLVSLAFLWILVSNFIVPIINKLFQACFIGLLAASILSHFTEWNQYSVNPGFSKALIEPISGPHYVRIGFLESLPPQLATSVLVLGLSAYSISLFYP